MDKILNLIKNRKQDVVYWLHHVYGLQDGDLLNAGEVQELLESFKTDTDKAYIETLILLSEERIRGWREMLKDDTNPHGTALHTHGFNQALTTLIDKEKKLLEELKKV